MGTRLLSPGSWCAQGFVCALQESVPPVLWKFYNEIPLASKVKFPRGSLSLCQIPRLGNLLWVLELLLTVQELLWYNCSPVCGSSAQWLNDRANSHLLQEDLCLMPCLSGLLQSEPLSLWQAAADPCLPGRHSHTQRQVWLILCGVPGS